MNTSIAVLGDGAWGTAVALVLAKKPEQHVRLWSAREENGRTLQQRRENVRYLPGVAIPETITLTIDLIEATDRADLWVLAVPTVYLRATLEQIRNQVEPGPPVVSLAKGIERRTFLRPSQIIREVLGVERVAILSGPSHAEEVAREMPATVVVAGEDGGLAQWVQELFRTERFRVYTNLDPVGVELAGALKNVIGLAAGICEGLGLGDNARAALLTRGMVEMTRFGVALGALPQTFSGLAGIGDLITTCISPHGRNRQVGLRLARGEKLSRIQQTMPQVAEGVYTTESVYQRALQMGVDMPITAEVYRVLYEDKDPRRAVDDLMTRDPKREQGVFG